MHMDVYTERRNAEIHDATTRDAFDIGASLRPYCQHISGHSINQRGSSCFCQAPGVAQEKEAKHSHLMPALKSECKVSFALKSLLYFRLPLEKGGGYQEDVFASNL